MNNNITIGIVCREEIINDTKVKVITKNNLKYLDNLCNYIGLINYNDKFNLNTLNICDGIIIQGGSNIFDYHYDIVKYAINNNIPLLGICMGHQIIGLYSDSCDEKDLCKVDNHHGSDIKHLINIKTNSFLYKVLGSKCYVNSRHFYKLKNVNDPFKITALSDDNVIEAIEYIDNNHFILGVQWHPEDMDNMQNLYNCFFEEVVKRKKKK